MPAFAPPRPRPGPRAAARGSPHGKKEKLHKGSGKLTYEGVITVLPRSHGKQAMAGGPPPTGGPPPFLSDGTSRIPLEAEDEDGAKRRAEAWAWSGRAVNVGSQSVSK